MGRERIYERGFLACPSGVCGVHSHRSSMSSVLSAVVLLVIAFLSREHRKPGLNHQGLAPAAHMPLCSNPTDIPIIDSNGSVWEEVRVTGTEFSRRF